MSGIFLRVLNLVFLPCVLLLCCVCCVVSSSTPRPLCTCCRTLVSFVSFACANIFRFCLVSFSCVFKLYAGVPFLYRYFVLLSCACFVFLSVVQVSFVSFSCAHILCFCLVSFSCVFKCCASVPQIWVSPTCCHPLRKAQIRPRRRSALLCNYVCYVHVCTTRTYAWLSRGKPLATG